LEIHLPRSSIVATPDALVAALGDEALGAAELTQRLGCSQPTLSRLVRAAGAQVLTLGKAKQTRYARARPVQVEQPLPITRIDAAGAPHNCGTLHTIGLPSGSRTAWVAPREVDVFDGLPWFVIDMRPQGFIGRQFPARIPQLGLPPSIADWNDNHMLQALNAAGSDEPGDLVLGRAALEQYLLQPLPEPISARRKASAYSQLAQPKDGQHSPSSAGGEQSKFTAYAQTPQGARHTIVKFSPTGADAVAVRWRDLLRCEHHALRVLHDNRQATGLEAAQTLLIDADRAYLEVQRFDRIGPRGRRGVVSLGAIDDVFVGQRNNWVQTAQQLQGLRMLRERDVRGISLLYAFGLLIHNSDMHFGNLSLLHEGPASVQFSLAPCYDMLPMRFAPTAQGLRPLQIPKIVPQADLLEVWPQALLLAREFWSRVIADPAVSLGFVQIAKAAIPTAH
jgi:HipA-like C-terminal domain